MMTLIDEELLKNGCFEWKVETLRLPNIQLQWYIIIFEYSGHPQISLIEKLSLQIII